MAFLLLLKRILPWKAGNFSNFEGGGTLRPLQNSNVLLEDQKKSLEIFSRLGREDVYGGTVLSSATWQSLSR
jgi:hypothetical protein